MATVQPKGEDVRKAIKWISENLKYEKDKSVSTLIAEACRTFNLSPKDEVQLREFYKEK